ncbi:MAG: MFS transporter [Candidatus Anaerobiospirillum pullicola]|uniref:MFS transporter n=1 Tax=Candidatus Anaerobiospirillum pullicola TaxID=2838451 RepID=A0A948TIB0_9GAMM|nr:MFS transporter [Candidatus Anaerobiospirillum pullicola]
MNWKVVLAIMTCNVVLMSASYTMLIPFLPLYLRDELGANPETLNMWTGAIFAISFAVCAVMAPIWGKMTDSKGKKLMIIRSSSLIALTYLCGGLVQTPLQMFFVRILQGFAAGLWPASLALVSSYTPKNKVGICMGVMQSANICGGILGPLFGGVLAEAFGIRTSFFIAAGALIIITLVTIFFIKEPSKAPEHKKAPAPSYRELFNRAGLPMILFATGLTNMVILLLQPIMTLYIGELRGHNDNLILISGLVFSLSGIAGAIAAPIWGRRGQSIGFFKTLVTSLTAAGVLIACQFLPNTLVPFAILQFCVGLGFSGIFPSANAMVINLTSPLERGSAFGMLFSAQQIGGAIGPLIGGLIATYVNLASIFFVSGCILVMIALTVYLKMPAAVRGRPQETLHERPAQDIIKEIKEQAAKEVAQDMAREQQNLAQVRAERAQEAAQAKANLQDEAKQ